MSYEIKFRSRDTPSITVSTERGARIKELWFDSENKSAPVDIDGNAYVLGDIKSIISMPDPPSPKPFEQGELIAGKVCTGQQSIQNEINLISKSDHPNNWAKLIRDTKWRETTRKKLREAKDVKWCDYRAGECACD